MIQIRLSNLLNAEWYDELSVHSLGMRIFLVSSYAQNRPSIAIQKSATAEKSFQNQFSKNENINIFEK